MEETLEHHENAEDEVDMTSEHARYSPHATQVEEVLDALTAECFSSMVAPAVRASILLSRTPKY
jgi:tRNA A58 N-methylase Trm61